MAAKRTAARRTPARQTLPRYEADQGRLTSGQMDAIDRLQPSGRMKVRKRLF